MDWQTFRDTILRIDLYDSSGTEIHSNDQLLVIVNRALERMILDVSNQAVESYAGSGQNYVTVPDDFARIIHFSATNSNGISSVWSEEPVWKILNPDTALSASSRDGGYALDYPSFGVISLSRSLGTGETAKLFYHKAFDAIANDVDVMPFSARPYLQTPLSYLCCYYALLGEATNRSRSEQYLTVIDRPLADNPIFLQAKRFYEAYIDQISRIR